MSCLTCNSLGYQESYIARDSTNHPILLKCPNPLCKYHDNYYEEIRRRYSKKEDPILPEAPSISKDILEEAAKLFSEYPKGELILKTPFGEIMTTSLKETEKVVSIINSYLDYSEELLAASEVENVIVFPLARRLDK